MRLHEPVPRRMTNRERLISHGLAESQQRPPRLEVLPDHVADWSRPGGLDGTVIEVIDYRYIVFRGLPGEDVR